MYIGKIPATGAFQKCDALSASGTADYTLQVGSVNVVPESVNHMIVSLNGVIQAPTTAYTVAGSTLSFASSLTSSDSIDFILLLGNVLDIGTPSDDTVTLAKLAAGTDGNIISYDASGNPVAIATGSDGQVLTSAGAGQPPAFEAAAAGGKIGQVVSAIITASQSTTSTTAVTTGLAVTITPVATSSKIWLTANIGSFSQNTYASRTFFTIVGGNAATYKGDAATGHECSSVNCVERADYSQTGSQINYLDSPATTGATTYTLYYWSSDGTTVLNAASTTSGSGGNSACSITAMEVLA